jgi:amino acid adenylation domain-containing protein
MRRSATTSVGGRSSMPLAKGHHNLLGGDRVSGATFPDFFAEQVRTNPSCLAAADRKQVLTYSELNQRAEVVAQALRTTGMGPDVAVGVCLDQGVDMLISMVGIFKAGAAYLPMDPAHPAARLAFLIDDAQPAAILSKAGYLDRLPTIGPPYIGVDRLDPIDAAGTEHSTKLPTARPGDLAYIIYTSGSTGRPKGVMIEHRHLANLLTFFREVAPWVGPGVSVVNAASPTFDMSVLDLFWPLSCGAAAVITGYAHDAEWVRRCPPRLVAAGTPSTWPLLLDLLAGCELTLAITGGEALTPTIARRLLATGAEVWNLYGPTEATVWSTFFRVTDVAEAAARPIGSPIRNTHVFVVDDSLRPVRRGEPGELLIGGAGIARGYLNLPKLTSERFVMNSKLSKTRLYRTGDRVRARSDGCLEFLGRVDDQVKIRGFRIECGEVEALLSSHSTVREAIVVAQGDAADRNLVAFIRTDAAPPPSEAELVAACTSALPEYMVPARFTFLKEFPLTENGKVDRRALEALGLGPIGRDYIAPVSAREQVLARIWSEVLDVERVGVTDNFVELGGDSIKALQVVARARHKGFVLHPRELLADGTISKFARATPTASPAVARVTDPIEPEATADLPLSVQQETAWLLHELAPNSTFLMDPIAYEIHGRLDTGRLFDAFQLLAERHDVFSTSFRRCDGRPSQRFGTAPKVEFEVCDLTAHRNGNADAPFRELLRHRAQAPVDLEQGPLTRLIYARSDTGTDRFVLTMHALIADGYSYALLGDELCHAYNALCSGQPPELVPSTPYREYVQWQRQMLDLERLSTYWRGAYSSNPGVRLPADRPKGDVPVTRGALMPYDLDAQCVSLVATFARTEGLTTYAVLLAAFFASLAAIGDRRPLVVGGVSHGRHAPEFTTTVGCLSQGLFFIVDPTDEPSFRELAHRSADAVARAIDHEELPLAEWIKLRPGLGDEHEILFQLDPPMPVLSFSAPGAADSRTAAVPWWSHTSQSGTDMPPTDLYVTLRPDGRALRGDCIYDSSQFEERTVHKLLHRFAMLLRTALRRPDATIGQLIRTMDAE